MNNGKTLDVRPSPIAGTWYPGTEAALKQTMATLFAPYEGEDSVPLAGEVLGLVVPHAGYVYSGASAAAAFRAVAGQSYSKVLIISPSHRAYSYPLITSGHDAYQTPLGLARVDHQALSELHNHLQGHGLGLKSTRFDEEHSLEIELPFLQYLLGTDFTLLPVMMVDQSQKTALALAQALFELIQSLDSTERVLLIASTDLSHFHPQRVARRLDEAFIEALKTGSATALYEKLALGKTEACGLGPAATILKLCEYLGANRVTISDYRDSSYASGDKSSVVGYVSAIITREDNANA